MLLSGEQRRLPGRRDQPAGAAVTRSGIGGPDAATDDGGAYLLGVLAQGGGGRPEAGRSALRGEVRLESRRTELLQGGRLPVRAVFLTRGAAGAAAAESDSEG